MEPFTKDNQSGKPAHHYSVRLAMVLVIIQIIVTVVTYPLLPEMVPSHWNIVGEVDGYMPKSLNVIFLLGLSLGTWIVLLRRVQSNHQISHETRNTTATFTELILPFLVLLSLSVQLIQFATVQQLSLNLPMIIICIISLLFIVAGNYFGKLRRNFWVGIRTPWTLASDTVWERTHRLGGWIFVAVGGLGIVLSLFATPPVLFICFVGGILGSVCLLVAYSYIVFQRVKKNGEDRLSSPFHHDN